MTDAQAAPFVIIGIPHVGGLPGYFVDAMQGLQWTGLAAPPVIVRVENQAVDLARNRIAATMMHEYPQATHLLFIDADERFPPKTLERLLERDRDIIAGTYFSRTNTPVPHGYFYHHTDNEDGTCPLTAQHADHGRWYRPVHREFAEWSKRWKTVLDSYDGAAVLPYLDGDVIECDAVATGAMLIKREVLEAVADAHPDDPHPWFKNHPRSAGGEDFYFCERAREAGFRVWIDFSVQIQHEMKIMVDREDFAMAFRVGQEDEWDFSEDVLVQVGGGGDNAQRTTRMPADFAFPFEVEGYLDLAEGIALFELAKALRPEGMIVELGSYKGKSAICLGQAGRRVITIDHHRGEGRLEPYEFVHDDHKRGSYSRELDANLRLFRVDQNVEAWVQDTVDAGKRWDGPYVDLLFIDADHSADAARKDWEAWRRNLGKDATVVLDDADFPGVKALQQRMATEGWRTVDRVGKMAVMKRGTDE